MIENRTTPLPSALSRLLLVLALAFTQGGLLAQKMEEKTWENGTPRSRESLDKKGFKTGECVYFHQNGQIRLRENYEKGRRSGKCEGWFEDGTPEFTRNYVVMQRNNGSLAGTEPVAVKDGEWTEYHGNGSKKKEEHFALGVLQGVVRTWYENAQLEELKTMADKFEEGAYEHYYENGQVFQKGAYAKGEWAAGLS
jgi:antitoxin component YwqK of YwqJK toxin-antitoxin module